MATSLLKSAHFHSVTFTLSLSSVGVVSFVFSDEVGVDSSFSFADSNPFLNESGNSSFILLNSAVENSMCSGKS